MKMLIQEHVVLGEIMFTFILHKDGPPFGCHDHMTMTNTTPLK